MGLQCMQYRRSTPRLISEYLVFNVFHAKCGIGSAMHKNPNAETNDIKKRRDTKKGKKKEKENITTDT